MAASKILDIDIGKIGIWKLEGPCDKLIEAYSFLETEKTEFDLLKNEKRKKEYLAVRLLIEKMLGTKTSILYYNRKPQLINKDFHISISHSSDLAVVLLSEKKSGIDVENIFRKTEQVASRFLSEKELENILITSNPQLSRILYWCAKEAVYKYSDLADIEFKKHVSIFPFTPETGGGKFRGELRHRGFVAPILFHYFFFENNVVLYCVEGEKFP